MESLISATRPLASQVGGHAGVLTTEDGSLIIKPALPLELLFYQALNQNAELEPLRPFLPKFFGTLKLEGQIDENAIEEEGLVLTPLDIPEKDELSVLSIVLENLSYPFLKPNILDVKLGTVLYDEAATPDKIERMEQTARETTSHETGIRLTGFQMYDNNTSQPINTPKSYGKSIKPADLPEGIARFFALGTEDGSSNTGLPRATVLPLLRSIREDIADIREIIASLEARMVGMSLLIVYEADWALAAEGVKRLGLEADEEDEDDDDDDEDDDDDDESKRPGPPYVVKLIDFAHTRVTPGKGPDEGVVFGFDTVLRLLDGRIAQISESGQ
ncbi:Inositol polyphosphate multikinase [Hypsizygus marmoreus]|uniref:Kinase n=1 Tax=Hypsizygus marmoreus TaxID=39966 RepID=A0A369JBM0_HYPMA|nr:Inositol polyphosphate multikinase [Hypsizygus marmoreus]